MRIVASLSSTCKDDTQLMQTIDSITQQSVELDAIYLCVPFESDENLDTYTVNCSVIRCKDYGSCTSLIGPLLHEDDLETIIITFDENVVYPETLVEKLVAKHQVHPGSAIGSAGVKLGRFPFYVSSAKNEPHNNWYTFPIDSHGQSVDIIWNYPGVLYKRGFFSENLDELLDFPANLYDTEILVSGVLSRNGIERRIFHMPRVDAMSVDRKLFASIKAVYRCWKLGLFKKHAKYQRYKTFTWPFVLSLGFLVAISILFSIRQKV